jgi:ABC-type transport system involved in cytochrome c biogenesis ATPase subunit
MEAAQTAVAYDKSSVTPVGTEGGMRQSLGTALTLPRQPPSSSYDARGAARADGFSKVRLFGGLVTKRGLSARRDFCTTSCMIFFPVVLVWLALALLNVTGSFIATPKPMPLTPEATFPKLVGVSGGQEIKRPVPLVLPEGNVAASSWAPTLNKLGWNVNQPGQVSGDNVFPNVTIGLSAYLLANPSAVLPAALAFSPDTPIAGTTEVVGVASLLFNSTATLSPPALVNTLYDTLVQLATGSAVSIAGSMQSLPVSDQTKATFDSFISLFASIMILIPFAFVAAQFVVPLVRERESGSKQMQFISGVGPVIYWLSNWAWDALMFLIIAASTLVVFVIQNRSEFTGTTEAFGGTTLLLLTFGVAVVPLSSAASFGFTTPSNGLIVMIAFHFLSGFGLNVCDFILQSISTETQKINDGLRYLYRLFPAYCLGQGFFSMSTRQLVANFAAFGQPQPKLYDWDQLGAPITYLFLEGLGFMDITLVLQYAESDIKLQQRLFGPFERLQRLFRPIKRRQHFELLLGGLGCLLLGPLGGLCGFPRGGRAPAAGPTGAANGGDRGGTDGLPVAQGRRGRAERSSIEDMSVLEERQVIDEGGAETSDSAALLIKHLRREFGPKVAVRDLCLRIGRGECFGFLGVNGAGKSTTFSMLTGSLVPTSGDALLEGMSILHEQNKIRRLVGYCPQHDALEALMTAREALRMYAKIKDVAPGSIEAEVEDLIQDLDLSKFADKPCGTYSGGNKRKLCVGIALVGSPQVTTSDGL